MTTATVDTTYSIRVFTTEGCYAADTVTADNYTDAACMFLGAITWMDTDPAAAIQEVQLSQRDYVISLAYADDTTRPLLNETVQTRALADYRAALASETKRWSYVGSVRNHYHALIAS
jgi:hypothetical protein